MNARQKRKEDLSTLAREAYANHTVLGEEGPGMWTICRAKSGIFYARIIAAFPHVIVVGDGPNAIFYGGDGGWSPEQMVRWVAESSDGYMAGKLDMGISGAGLGHERDESVAMETAREYLKEARTEGTHEEIVAWDDAIDALESGDIDGARRLIWEGVQDGGEIELGRVISSRFFYAREACRALLRLLDERRELCWPTEEPIVIDDLNAWLEELSR